MEGRLFDLFSTGRKDGTGLGLAIVRKIVQDHGGAITYTSEPGRGTTFVVRIPIERAAQQATP
jgi:two-component system nitrogen regulation sensor histidine kinase GlnL